MLKARIAAALVVVASMYFLLYLDTVHASGWGFATVLAILGVMGLREFYRMTEAKGWAPFHLFGYAMMILLVYGTELWCLQKYHDWERFQPDIFSTLLGVSVLGTLMLQIWINGPRGALGNVAGTLLGLVYIWYLPSYLLRIRHLGLNNGWEIDGIEFVLTCIFVAKVSDVGGLLVGSSLGKTRLCPTLSPKKTWEGTIGGVFFSMGTIALMAAFNPGGAVVLLGWPRILLLGAILAVSSLLGDLVESAFKRDCEVKDAGGSVPGFGGVLDLTDSLMVSAPVMYFYLTMNGARPGAGLGRAMLGEGPMDWWLRSLGVL